jgi:hypothetical protein
MGDYLRIARVYLRGTTAAAWCFLLLCLLAVSASAEELAHHQGGLLGGILSRKSYMAMFVYFNACLLGVLLRDNIAHPWASVVPHYRRKHLLVAAVIALLFLGIPMFSMQFVGASDLAPTSVAVIFLTCLAAGLWTLHHSALGFLALPFLVFVAAPSAPDSVLARFLAGAYPMASAALMCISLAALGVFSRRLLVLNEGMSEYALARLWGNLLRGRGQAQTFADYLAALPADQRATVQNYNWQKQPYSNLKQVDELSGYTERSVWQRLQLWRLGTAPTRTSVSVGYLMVITLFVMPLFLYPQLLPAGNTVVIFSVQVMLNPVVIWLPWFMRLQRLGYESLRPRTRQEFVRELGLVLLWDTFQCWLGGVLFMGLTAAIWAPELLQFRNVLLFILCTAAGQLCAYALMGIWFLKFLNRGMLAGISCAFCPFLAIVSWILFVVMNGHLSFEVNLAIASLLAAASAATIPLAYRRWCRADLD